MTDARAFRGFRFPAEVSLTRWSGHVRNVVGYAALAMCS